MRRQLHFQADRIEMVLATHKVPARVTGGTVTPRLVRYHVSTPLGVKVRQVAGLSEEIAMSLGAPSCRVYRQQGQVEVEVPREQGQVVHLMSLARRLAAERLGGGVTVPPATALLGLDQDGAPLLVRLPSPNVAHVLVAGTTGSGKTALLRTIVASLAVCNRQRALQLVLVDPKGRGFGPFAGLPHLLVPVIEGTDEAVQMLGRLVEEMERRDAEGRSEPRLVLVLDELADLVQTAGTDFEGRLVRLMQRGREAGIHVVACTQKPSAAVLSKQSGVGGLIKSNFPVRVVGAVASPEDAKVATGLAGTGAERLLGQGDFLVVAKGHVTRMQAAYISPEEALRLVQVLRAGAAPLTGTDARWRLLEPPVAAEREVDVRRDGSGLAPDSDPSGARLAPGDGTLSEAGPPGNGHCRSQSALGVGGLLDGLRSRFSPGR
jgi:S-DNA-T family DNA segregation ATPase FtsK/SpoIIIE